MKKNFGENFESLQINSITGEYCIPIPESIINELSWYEDTEISIKLEGSEIVISEKKN